MRKIGLYNMVAVLFLLGGLPCTAQTLSADLQKIKTRFDSQEAFSASIDVKYYRNESDKLPGLYKKGIVKKLGPANYYSSFDNKEFLVNKKYTVIVDKNNKIIIVNNTRAATDTHKDKQFSIPEMSKQEEENVAIKRVEAANLVTYYVSDKKTGKMAYSIAIDLSAGYNRISKITYYGGNSYQKTEILYKYPAQPPVFSKEEFSEAKYIRWENKEIKPTAAFAAYQISNQTR